MNYSELKQLFRELKRTSPRDNLTAHIIFTEDSFNKPYPLLSRTYAVSSDNKAFWPGMGGYSIFAEEGSIAMQILIIEPGHRPRAAKINGTLESMEEIVGGRIQAMYPSEDIALVFNNDPNGPLLPQNRAVRNEIVRGTFFLCGAPEDSNYFISLTKKQLRHYKKVFALPEIFLDLGGRTIILPCKEYH